MDRLKGETEPHKSCPIGALALYGIRVLQDASIAFVQREEKATAPQVHGFIRDLGLVRGKQLHTADITHILQSLVYDARLEETAPRERPATGAGSHDEPLYRVAPPLPRESRVPQLSRRLTAMEREGLTQPGAVAAAVWAAVAMGEV